MPVSWHSPSNTVCRDFAHAPVSHAFNVALKHYRRGSHASRTCQHARIAPRTGRLVAPTTCSAVVDRPPEFDLHSVDLDWPKGFPSRYALGQQLGKGSFGTVYLATDRVSGEEVAAKVIPKERQGTTREHILEKIQQEVSCCQSLLALNKLLACSFNSWFASNGAYVCDSLQVDVLRRMQGRDEALKLLAVYEVHNIPCTCEPSLGLVLSLA